MLIIDNQVVMAMIPNAMASQIVSYVSGCTDAATANNKLWQAICDYVSANAQVMYSWVGLQPSVPSPIPDPMVMLTCTIQTGGTLTPSGQNTAAGAFAALTAAMNANCATWMIMWPPGFALSPAFVMPTISLSPSGATDQMSAMTMLCTQIIAGLKMATPMASGTHGGFIGSPGASFVSII